LQEERAGLQLSKEAFDELYHERNIKLGNPFEEVAGQDDIESSDDSSEKEEVVKKQSNSDSAGVSSSTNQLSDKKPARPNLLNQSSKTNAGELKPQTKPSPKVNTESKSVHKGTNVQSLVGANKELAPSNQILPPENPGLCLHLIYIAIIYK
jgi:hypothetical protein